MPFAAFLGGTVAPVLLMLSPFAVMAAKDCSVWKPAAKVAKVSGETPCTRARPPLM